MVGRKKSSGIPFPAKDPRYHKVWELVNQQGKTLEEALVIVGGAPVIKEPDKLPRKPAIQKNGKVPAADLLDHPDVPDSIKEKIRATIIGNRAPTNAEAISLLLACLQHVNVNLESIDKKIDRTNTHLAEIVRALIRIADREDPKPGMEGTVSLSSPPPAAAEKSSRTTDNGLVVGDRVKRIKSGEIGKITRILPGRNEVEIRFMLGSKTLPVDQVQLVEANGK